MQVAVRRCDGSLVFEEIYAFGHRDASDSGSFVQLTVKPIDANMSDPAVESSTLELTALHFVPVSSGLQITFLRTTSTQTFIIDSLFVSW